MGRVLRRSMRRLRHASWLLAATRVLDLTGAFNEPMPYSRSRTTANTDAAAIAKDWQAVGDDLRTGFVKAQQR